MRLAGGGALIRRLGAEPKAPVCLGLSLGGLSWEIQIPVEGGSIHPNHGEEVKLGDHILARRAMYADGVILGKKHTVWHNPTEQTVTVQALARGFMTFTIPPGESAVILPDFEPDVIAAAPQLVKAGELYKDGERWRDDPRRSVLEMLAYRAPTSDVPPEVVRMIDLVPRDPRLQDLLARRDSRATVGRGCRG